MDINCDTYMQDKYVDMEHNDVEIKTYRFLRKSETHLFTI